MVQEVQTWVGITNENTLETIEAIGTSSFKIVEWRQTKGWHYVSSCEAVMLVRWHYVSGQTDRQSPLVKWDDVSITSMEWNAEYTVRDSGIRVPAAWTYEIKVSAKAGGTSYSGTTYIKVWPSAWDPTIYSLYGSSTKSEDKTFRVNLGKFDVLTIWGDFHYDGSAATASTSWNLNPIIITQL